MATVLVDARVGGHTGVGRYARTAAAALSMHAGPEYQVEVLARRTGTPCFTDAEDRDLLEAVEASGADLIHLLDYRIPLTDAGIPVICTVHDVMWLLYPQYCDTDAEFATRFGADVFRELADRTAQLRALAPLPPGRPGEPCSVVEEHYGRMLMYAVNHAAAVITPTRAVADALRELTGTGNTVTVSPWGIDHAAVIAPPAKPGRIPKISPAAPDFLLYIGRYRPHKGVDTLLEAMCGEEPELSEHVRLACVGPDFDPGEPGARALAERLGARGLAIGSVDDAALAHLLRRADMLVHPAEYEGFGFAPLEALAADVAVIASDIPVLHETLGGHAMFADFTDHRSLARLVSSVWAGHRAGGYLERRLWSKRHTWQRHADDVLETYGRILEKQPPSSARAAHAAAYQEAKASALVVRPAPPDAATDPAAALCAQLDAVIEPLRETAGWGLRLWAVPDAADQDVPRQVFDLIHAADLLDILCESCDQDHEVGPVNAADLAARLDVLSSSDVFDLALLTCTRTLAYHRDERPLTRAQATPLIRLAIHSLGPDAAWWTNTRLSGTSRSWSSVTGHTFDQAVIGSGNGVLLVIVAVAED